MRGSLSFLLVPALIFISHCSSIITYSIVRNLKLGNYVTPFIGWKFEHWSTFLISSLAIFQPIYFVNGFILFTAYKLSFDHLGTMYPAVVLNLVAIIFWTIFMMYLRVKEVPTRDGWIAIVLIVVASLLAMNAGKNIGPR